MKKMTKVEAKLRNKLYSEPEPVWASEKQYLQSKALSIVLVATLLSQNGYDFEDALDAIYSSKNVYDEISDWKGEGCLYPEEVYYDDICAELGIVPVGYDFKKIQNPKIGNQLKVVYDLEMKRYKAK